MHVQLRWGALLLLAGCQLNQPVTTPTPESSNRSDIHQTGQNAQPNTTTPSETIKILSPETSNDVWQRIAMQLNMEVPNDPTVDYYRNWYLNNLTHIQTVAERAQPFLHRITEKVEQRGLPLELALLPIVESSFDVLARSSGGAAGLWQFMPKTGSAYGLKQNFWYDGRLDIDASTDAALDYLTDLNQRFNGDWLHAIAAYNSGGGRVSSAITKNRKQGKPTDFFNLELPKETSAYVPKLLALADIVANQDKYGISIPTINNEPVLKAVDPKEQLDFSVAAKFAGIGVNTLKSYNPAYPQAITAPDSPQILLLPIESVESFINNVEANQGKTSSLTRYKVVSGDSLSAIAQKYHTTTALLQKLNKLKNSEIFIGQYLLVPAQGSSKNNNARIIDKSTPVDDAMMVAKISESTIGDTVTIQDTSKKSAFGAVTSSAAAVGNSAVSTVALASTVEVATTAPKINSINNAIASTQEQGTTITNNITTETVASAPVISTPVVSVPAVPTLVASTPVVSVPAVSTPVASTPTLSVPAVSTPAASTPALSVPTVSSSEGSLAVAAVDPRLKTTFDDLLPAKPSLKVDNKAPEVVAQAVSDKVPTSVTVAKSESQLKTTFDELMPAKSSVKVESKMPEVVAQATNAVSDKVPTSVTVTKSEPQLKTTFDELMPAKSSVKVESKMPEVVAQQVAPLATNAVNDKVPASVTVTKSEPQLKTTFDELMPAKSSVKVESKMPEVVAPIAVATVTPKVTVLNNATANNTIKNSVNVTTYSNGSDTTPNATQPSITSNEPVANNSNVTTYSNTGKTTPIANNTNVATYSNTGDDVTVAAAPQNVASFRNNGPVANNNNVATYSNTGDDVTVAAAPQNVASFRNNGPVANNNNVATYRNTGNDVTVAAAPQNVASFRNNGPVANNNNVATYSNTGEATLIVNSANVTTYSNAGETAPIANNGNVTTYSNIDDTTPALNKYSNVTSIYSNQGPASNDAVAANSVNLSHHQVKISNKKQETYRTIEIKPQQPQIHSLRKTVHVVKTNETLESIAQQHQVSPESIKEWNNIASNNSITQGKTLAIWKNNDEYEDIRVVYYQTKEGDSANKIAKKFQISSKNVAQWNGLVGQESTPLVTGQTIKLYIDVAKMRTTTQ